MKYQQILPIKNMPMIRLKLFIYAIIFFNTLASTTSYSTNSSLLATASKITDIYEIKDCRKDCCIPIDSKTCYIFYTVCRTKEYQDGIFVITNENLENWRNFLELLNKIKKYSKPRVVLIAIKKKIYFSQSRYETLETGLISNIKQLEQYDEDSKKVYIMARKRIRKALNETEKVEKLKLGVPIISNKYNNIYYVLKEYERSIDHYKKQYTNKEVITEYEYNVIAEYTQNKNHKASCIKKLTTTNKPLATHTTFVYSSDNTRKVNTIASTMYSSTDIPLIKTNATGFANNNINLLGNDYQPSTVSSYSSEHIFNKLPIIITAIVAPVVVISVLAVLIYKTCKKSSNSVINTDTLESNTQKTDEPLYDEPYDLPVSKVVISSNYNDIVQPQNLNNNILYIAKSQEHLYIDCIADDDLVNAKQSTISDEQQDIAIPTTDNSHIYHILENNNENENSRGEQAINNSSATNDCNIDITHILSEGEN